MTAAITFALLSLFSAGCLDVSFKRYSRKARSRGIYLAICGVTWTALQITYFVSQNVALIFNFVTLIYGLAAGIILALANLLLIESLTALNLSVGSTIYRLNTVAVVFLSLIIFGPCIRRKIVPRGNASLPLHSGVVLQATVATSSIVCGVSKKQPRRGNSC